MLDFVEQYNRFESEKNQNEYHRLSLVYENISGKDITQQMISHFGSGELGKLFKIIARDDGIRKLVDNKIRTIIDFCGPK